MLVAIAFADLAGYTQLTERRGDLHALDIVDRFVGNVVTTLPEDARVIKTIGDGVMVAGPDPVALTGWALRLGELMPEHPRRAAVHYGYARYRDGDYLGREVNLAARIQEQSGAGEVLVTRAVVDAAAGGDLRFERVADVQLRGFDGTTELFRVLPEAARVSVVAELTGAVRADKLLVPGRACPGDALRGA